MISAKLQKACRGWLFSLSWVCLISSALAREDTSRVSTLADSVQQIQSPASGQEKPTPLRPPTQDELPVPGVDREVYPRLYSEDGEVLPVADYNFVTRSESEKKALASFERIYTTLMIQNEVFYDFDLVEMLAASESGSATHAELLQQVETQFYEMHHGLMAELQAMTSPQFFVDRLVFGVAGLAMAVTTIGAPLWYGVLGVRNWLRRKPAQSPEADAASIAASEMGEVTEAPRGTRPASSWFTSLWGGGGAILGLGSMFGISKSLFDGIQERRELKKIIQDPRSVAMVSRFALMPEFKQYLSFRHYLRKKIVAKLDAQLVEAWKAAEGGVDHSPHSPVKIFKKTLAVAADLPHVRHRAYFKEADLRRRLARHKVDLKEALVDFAFAEFTRNRILLSGQGPLSFSFPAYFVGSPGTGKTYAVKQLAESLQMPFSTVDLDGATVASIEGSAKEPGKLLEAIISRGPDEKGPNTKSRILFMDEFDRLLTAGTESSRTLLAHILKIFDPGVRAFYSPFLGDMVDLPDSIILAGNFEISRLVDERFDALGSRLNVISFEGFERESVRKVIFEDLIPDYLERASKVRGGYLALKELHPQDAKLIHDYIDRSDDRGLRSAQKYAKRIVDRAIKQVYQSRSRVPAK
ncbi:MAG: AAA family ATPase [Zetaproteobacteria bacterium]|nr:AAA family ATPase [Zetaproteobacteria bacterium]